MANQNLLHPEVKSKITKKIVCLANSRKNSMHCIAGKEIIQNGSHVWIRPVSNLPSGEISLSECQYEQGGEPEVLDYIKIVFEKHSPSDYQTENYIIDSSIKWKKIGKLKKVDLDMLVDKPDSLWGSGYSTINGCNDRVPYKKTSDYKQSLYFIKLRKVTFTVRYESMRKRVRASFLYNGINYNLMVTDPSFENRYTNEVDIIYKKTIYLCISLGVKFADDNCYKLVAGVIEY